MSMYDKQPSQVSQRNPQSHARALLYGRRVHGTILMGRARAAQQPHTPSISHAYSYSTHLILGTI
eukprot:scaffold18149_cov129-Isochrysis_galbana.AAC.4